MTVTDNLHHLADIFGVATRYTSSDNTIIEISDETLIHTLKALGVPLATEDGTVTAESVTAAITRHEEQEFSRPLPPCVVATQGETLPFPVHVHDGAPADVWITLEDGTATNPYQVDNWNPARTIDGVTWGEATFVIPDSLPLGWHELHLLSDGISAHCQLIVTPKKLSTTQRYIEHPVTGVMAQVYSVRSHNSWGLGDFHDMGELCSILGEKGGADFLLINPLHAAEPFPPVEDSPYLPTSRRFINPIYIRPGDIEEYQALPAAARAAIDTLGEKLAENNHSSVELNRNAVFTAKLSALRAIFRAPISDERADEFDAYSHREGQGLADFSLWCARKELAARRAGLTIPGALTDLPKKDDPQAEEEYLDQAALFYKWLQWICDQQLSSAQKRATDAGMSIGLMADLAVGVHPAGATADILSDVLVHDSSVGAPADGYNQRGQDWSQPPWHPVKLAEDGYRPWRDMLRTVLSHSGGIRVDHVLGLFRLWWIPRFQSPLQGTYVRYDYNALIGILILEAERAGAIVIGEDLGTFEPWVQQELTKRGIMGTSVLWFEGDPQGDGPRRQYNYRSLALTSVTTHDLPPTAGLLKGEHITLREQLGLFKRDPAEEDREDLAWQNQVLSRVHETGCFDGTPLEKTNFRDLPRGGRGDIVELLAGLHRFVAGTPSALVCTALVDMVADIRTQNQPGTCHDQYPNWCIPLCDHDGQPVLIEDLPENPVFKKIAEAHMRHS